MLDESVKAVAKEMLEDFGCNTHKAMLLAKAFRAADHSFLSELLPERDTAIGEFRTSNMLDMFQMQVCIITIITYTYHMVITPHFTH